jgi:hypothetical protein
MSDSLKDPILNYQMTKHGMKLADEIYVLYVLAQYFKDEEERIHLPSQKRIQSLMRTMVLCMHSLKGQFSLDNFQFFIHSILLFDC